MDAGSAPDLGRGARRDVVHRRSVERRRLRDDRGDADARRHDLERDRPRAADDVLVARARDRHVRRGRQRRGALVHDVEPRVHLAESRDPDNNTTGATSTRMTFTDATAITGVKLKIKATHTYVSDLRFTLARGAASSIAIDRPGIFRRRRTAARGRTSTWRSTTTRRRRSKACAVRRRPRSAARPSRTTRSTRRSAAVRSAARGRSKPSSTRRARTPARWFNGASRPKSAPAATYSVGGTVTGMTGTGLTLKLNGGADFVLNANGAFTFPQQLAERHELHRDDRDAAEQPGRLLHDRRRQRHGRQRPGQRHRRHPASTRSLGDHVLESSRKRHSFASKAPRVASRGFFRDRERWR